MSAATVSSVPTASDAVRTDFLSMLPHVLGHARARVRQLACADRRAELVAEAVALAWQWYHRLQRRGKDPTQFVASFSRLAARAVWSGRRLCGQDKARDVLSPRHQRCRNISVWSLTAGNTSDNGRFDEALWDNTQMPVPDQVAFRLDFPAWVCSRPSRDRRLIAVLMGGERTLDAAHQLGISPARVSQLRREFLADWQAFCGDGSDNCCERRQRHRC
jgi:hypothetical protein